MNRSSFVVALLAAGAVLSIAGGNALAAPPEPPAEARPSKGTGFMVTGAVFSGVGAVTVLGTPSICKNGSPYQTNRSGCETFGYVLGAGFVAVGIPLIIVGIVKRSNYNKWLAEHPAAGVAAGLSLTPLAGGGALGWSTRF